MGLESFRMPAMMRDSVQSYSGYRRAQERQAGGNPSPLAGIHGVNPFRSIHSCPMTINLLAMIARVSAVTMPPEKTPKA